ncbi:hypothetical protein CONPUDRAFT_72197 [Coniophora puteana RWD-64-598 SS2]|uniref:Uncharacterized protein n=1 Tax=Coniophora puteana (strain RWD-64-598) TaxID=741705 RepID=A0A5M3MTF1_CONPW|nr:uncharacterized protein CONPUDRAFT_72197 [Coniophora puteana RWD-64-598 SS2]EIW81811.1 hypothetical protein CONPUDRAFT_72197 [Coniophora puteana RWD-64-598 SS2]
MPNDSSQSIELPRSFLLDVFRLHLSLIHVGNSEMMTPPPDVVRWSQDEALIVHCAQWPVPPPNDPKLVPLLQSARCAVVNVLRTDDVRSHDAAFWLTLLSFLPPPVAIRVFSYAPKSLSVQIPLPLVVDAVPCLVTTLSIISRKPLTGVTLGDLVAQLPQTLKVLSLVNSVTIPADVVVGLGHGRIPIRESSPSVEKIYIEDDISTINAFFNLIDVPFNTRLHARRYPCSTYTSAPEGPGSLLSMVCSTANGRWQSHPFAISSSQAELSLRQLRTAEGYGLVVSWGRRSSSSTGGKTELQFLIEDSSYASEASAFSALIACTGVLPYDDFPVVHVDGFDTRSARVQRRFWSLFTSRSRMVRLSVRGCNSQGSIAALERGLQDDVNSPLNSLVADRANPRSCPQPDSRLSALFSRVWDRPSLPIAMYPSAQVYANYFAPLLDELCIDEAITSDIHDGESELRAALCLRERHRMLVHTLKQIVD